MKEFGALEHDGQQATHPFEHSIACEPMNFAGCSRQGVNNPPSRNATVKGLYKLFLIHGR